MTLATAPGPPRARHSPYAQRLFEGGSPHRARVAQRTRTRSRAASAREERLRAALPLLMIAFVVALVLGLGMLPTDATATQRPDPAGYRDVVDLVSIDRVGTMFCATVSQGFFLEPAVERRSRIEALVIRVRSEGYGALYLFEASGRTLAWWNGDRLEVVPDGQPGS